MEFLICLSSGFWCFLLAGVNPTVAAVAQTGSASNSPLSGDGKQEKVN